MGRAKSAGDKWVELSNSIGKLARRYPSCTEAAELNRSWRKFWNTPIRRLVQSFSLYPPAYGALLYYWKQYDLAYEACQDEKHEPTDTPVPPTPSSIEPHFSEQAEAAVISTADDIAEGAGDAARAAADAVKDGVKSALSSPWPWLIGGALVLYYVGARRSDRGAV